MFSSVHYFCCKGTGSCQCKDSVYFRENTDFGFYSLADGLNSKEKSRTGGMAVQKAIADAFEERPERFFALPLSELQAMLIAIVHNVFYNLHIDNCSADEYASTLLVLFLSKKKGRFRCVHIGDGLIAKQTASDDIRIVSHPHNGITSRFTFTTASPCLGRHMRMDEGTFQKSDRFMLFTDGAIGPFYRNRSLTVNGEEFLKKGSELYFKILQQMDIEDDYSMLDIKLGKRECFSHGKESF